VDVGVAVGSRAGVGVVGMAGKVANRPTAKQLYRE
jgi:hypothetical protein